MNIYQPYFYVIGWTQLNIFYMGIQYGKNSHPSNLWSTYFTSSQYVKQFRQTHGEPDLIWSYPCKNAKEAIDMELRLMGEFDVANSPHWLNKNVGGAIVFDLTVRKKMSKPKSNEMKQKLSQKKAGQTPTLAHRQALSNAIKNKWLDEKYRAKVSNSLKGTKVPEERAKRGGESRKGRVLSPETRAKISASLKRIRAVDP